MKAVIFDLDGTIVFSHPTHFAAYEKVFEEFGITWNFEEFNNTFAGTGASTIIKTLLLRNGIDNYDLPALVAKKRDIFDAILREGKLHTVPGFFSFLKNINEKKLPKIIASGANKNNIRAMLENIGVSDDFPQIVSGEDVGNPKPAPDIFLCAAEKIHVSPLECVVFEDTEHGVRGAKAAGMKCIALSTTHSALELKKAGADEVVSDYTNVFLNDILAP